MPTSLYERLGGEAAIVAAVDVFYRRVLADEILRPYFETLEMNAQTRKQIAFMSWALGGPAAYRGRDLRVAHAKLVREQGLTDAHFDAVVAHLGDTLRELDVAPELVAETLRTIEGLRAEVLDR